MYHFITSSKIAKLKDKENCRGLDLNGKTIFDITLRLRANHQGDII